MLQILRVIFAIVAMGFAVYGLVTKNFEFGHFMIFFLGLMMLVMGLEEFQKEKKRSEWICIAVAIFSIFVSIQGFVLELMI